MKTHRFFLLLCLIITSITHAQNELFSKGNRINLVISVTDIPNDTSDKSIQKLEMVIPDSLKFNKKKDIRLRVILDYKSVIDTIRYFRLSKTVLPTAPYGASLPVIIPPIRKNDSLLDSFNNSDNYPYVFENPLHFHLKKHRLHLSLREYDNIEDYLNDDLGIRGVLYAEKMVNISFINRESDRLVARNSEQETFQVYPNPFDNKVFIEEENKGINETTVIDIYNINGVKVLEYNSGNQNQISQKQYNLDTSHLKKGIYYCYIRQGNKSYSKTILKK
ncbi:T9SS type A sorting domain-containing protein [Aquimarina sp. 2201CG14-23]|uniref:T9SS type A sorting domain-containing protein n=1 Tax=Aquimarina mycalae TaxID=3040073 RepID=UPI002477FE5D|nr:T9SS type A sorting domain-containing protein [Aquimarina sp. 2201CG14-23]MDH7444153.1 T9SS type A sorting domain-containing protein [Aquimarina sp. 2201CG14-23]